MPGKDSLHARLLDGFEHKSRKDGTVHTLHAQGQVIGEVCVGKRNVRLNLRKAPSKAPKNITLVGKSKSWAGGGVIVDEKNLTACRALLSAAVASTPVRATEGKGKGATAAQVA